MFHFVICLVFIIILGAEANVPETENPEIRLSYNFPREESYTVWQDKPLKIVVENASARLVWCFNAYTKYVGKSLTYENFVPDTKFSNDDVIILNIKNLTAAMSTRWSCTVLQEYKPPNSPYSYENSQYNAKTLRFNLHVRGARAVNLTANYQSLSYVTTNLSVNYDGEINYSYEDAEDFPIDFSCTKAEDNYKEDTLRLEYYNAEGILLFKTKPQANQPHIFRSVLKSNNDKYYLDCIRDAINPYREYRYRTTFIKRDLHAEAEQHAVILFVNGQKLSSFLNNDKPYEYIFKYIYGEVLNVTCRKMDANMRGSLTFSSDSNITSQTLRSSSEAVIISINTSTSNNKNKSLTCSINNTDVEKPNARLLFLSDVRDHDVRIRGLPRNNILYQYSNDENHWCIEYQYSVNDSLDLTCVANGGFHGVSQRQSRPHTNPFLWKFQAGTIDSAAIKTRDTQIKFSEILFTKILDTTHNGNKIKCTYLPNVDQPYINKSVEIVLRLKPEWVSEAAEDQDSSTDSEPPTVLITVGVGVVIFIITMLCLVLWRRRTKRLNLIENAYDNLSNQNESPIPAFPSQWEGNYDDSNYAKIDEGVMQENYIYSTNNDKSYSMSKRQSNTSENHYTEIDDYLKPKPDGLSNSNTAEPVNYNKQTDTHKSTASHSSNNASCNNFFNSKQGTYENLRHNNIPINNGNENYSIVKKPSKSVTFSKMSNDFRPGLNYSEGNSRQDGRNSKRNLKPNNDSFYANKGQNTNMQPGDMHKKPNYENNFLQNERPDNPLHSNYAEPYDELGISCKNGFYG